MHQPSPPGNTHPDSGGPAADQDSADERDYDAFAEDQDPLDIQAATWVARRRNGLDAASEAELRDWLDEDPSHQAAYDDMDGTFGRLRDMPADEAQALRDSIRPAEASQPLNQPAEPTPPAQRPLQQTPPRPASPGRRAWMLDIGRLFPQAAAAAVAFSVVGGGWLGWEHWRSQPTFKNHYATARGQQLRVELPDGSNLMLDTATQVEVQLYRDRREVRLLEGQALFSVQADAAQPFHVFAGGSRITVVGTRFSVRYTRSGLSEGETRVVVEEGRVRVARHLSTQAGAQTDSSDTAETAVELVAGQSIAANADGRLGEVIQVPQGSAAPWRDGRVNFDNTPLAQALAEFERYGATGLVIRDPAVAAMRVGGSFELKRFSSFARSLTQQLPVRLEPRGGAMEVVRVW